MRRPKPIPALDLLALADGALLTVSLRGARGKVAPRCLRNPEYPSADGLLAATTEVRTVSSSRTTSHQTARISNEPEGNEP